MQFHPCRAKQGIAGKARGTHAGADKGQRGALHAGRQTPYAALSDIPLHDDGGRPARL